jgi:hypothetical protein
MVAPKKPENQRRACGLADPGKNIEGRMKELSNGERAVCALNMNGCARLYAARFLVEEATGDTKSSKTARVDSHDVILFRLTPIKS